MNKKTINFWAFYTFFFFIFNNVECTSQAKSVSGYISDENSGEPLIGANISDLITGIVTPSNEYGYFNLTGLNDTVVLGISYIGYQTGIFHLGLKTKNTRIDFALRSSVNLPEAEITATGFLSAWRNSAQLVPFSLSQLAQAPMLAGEADPMKVFTMAPGISSNVEGTANLMVRGGSFEQNLILLDGAPVYNPVHLAGFLSVFNPVSIKKIDFYKAGIPSRFGGRLSSVVDVYMREGNRNEFHGEAGVGLTSAKFALEGPIVKDRLSFLFSARSSYMGILAALFQDPNYRKELIGSRTNYWLSDLNFKLAWRPDSLQQFYFSLYGGRDRGFIQEGAFSQTSEVTREELGWGNKTGVIRYNRNLSPRLFAKSWLIFTRYDYRFNTIETESELFKEEFLYKNQDQVFSSIEDHAAKIQLDYFPHARHMVKFGLELTRSQFDLMSRNRLFEAGTVTLSRDSALYNRLFKTGQWAIFGGDDWEITKKLLLSLGLRWSGNWLSGKPVSGMEPRIALAWLLGENMSLRFAFDQTRQNLHLITNGGIGFPNNTWAPATQRTPPSTGRQWSVEWQTEAQPLGIDFTLGMYFRTLQKLIDLNPANRNSFNFQSDWENVVLKNGVGKGHGVEFSAQKTEGPLNGWLSYTLAFAERKFQEINDGKPFPFTYDRRHNLAVNCNWKINEKWTLAFAWIFQTGIAATLPIAAAKDYFIYGEINAGRLPDYHRLDLSATFSKMNKRGNEHQMYYSFFNAYNRRNPLYLEIQPKKIVVPTPGGGEEVFTGYTVKQVSLFPIIPGFGYTFKF